MFNFKFYAQFFTLFGLVIFLSACSLKIIKDQSGKLEKAAHLSGKVTLDENNQYPVYVVLLKQHPSHVEIINQTLLDDSKQYQFDLLPGKYIIGAYIDENNNHQREQNEKASFYTQDEELFHIIEINDSESQVLESFAIEGLLDTSNYEKARTNLSLAVKNVGKELSLDDALFSDENSNLGLWQPFTFLEQVGGGLFMLQAYEKHKTPVVFVHGISGSPTEFSAIINQLDQERYQPWVLYYPSGLPLDIVSNYLLKSLSELKEQYDFSDINLIAHSMGGLMSRSFLMKHHEQKVDFDVSLFVTINSPLHGLESAANGVKTSPIVVASWRDLASGSDYINKVHSWKIPIDTPYHLIFSYLRGEEGDGVVPLSSQLSLSLQDEAIQIHGFEMQHALILKQQAFITSLNKILARHYLNNEKN